MNKGPSLEQRIENDFTYHEPDVEKLSKYRDIRERAKGLALPIVEHAPVSREQSLALTNLEQAVFWANAAIARNA